MAEDWIKKVTDEIKVHEAFMPFAYPDPLSPMGKRLGRTGITSCGTTGYLPAIEKTRLSEGNPWTIGYGCAKPWVKYGDKITLEKGVELLEKDIENSINDAKALLGFSWESLNGARKAVVVNMAYNMGRKTLETFVSTLKAIKENQFELAALHMSNSRWARQVPKRAATLITRMRTGVWA